MMIYVELYTLKSNKYTSHMKVDRNVKKYQACKGVIERVRQTRFYGASPIHKPRSTHQDPSSEATISLIPLMGDIKSNLQ